MEQLERRKLNHADIKVREVGTARTVEGYAARFNEESLWLPQDRCYEVIAPGAFSRSLQDNNIRALFNHVDSFVLGTTRSGTLRLEEDDQGLHFECELPDTSYARDLSECLRRGDIDGCSFGFTVDDQEFSKREDGMPLHILRSVNLIECSLGVVFPAYESTSISMRSLRKWQQEQDDKKKWLRQLQVFCNCLDS